MNTANGKAPTVKASNAQNVSIIVPVYNERANLTKLIKRIDASMRSSRIGYEVVLVDDHSNDGTKKLAGTLKQKYMVRYFLKKGKKGKAQSLLEGFSHAHIEGFAQSARNKQIPQSPKSNIVVIIDGDLQYPPETIPQMVREIEKGADIVIARRQYHHEGIIRRISGRLFSYVFGYLLHGFTVDIQSGLKAFKSSVVNQVSIQPRSGWMFDLEFLLQARTAGYKIAEVPFSFQKRIHGKSKVNLLVTSIEMALEAVRLKIRSKGVLPFRGKVRAEKGAGFYYQGREYVNYSELDLNESAFKRFTTQQKAILIFSLVISAAIIYLRLHLALVGLISIVTILYFFDLLFVFYLVYLAVTTNPSIHIYKKQLQKIREEDLPVYTILCPLYKESRVIRQFVSSIKQLDYPSDKLQVLILLEEDDKESIETASMLSLPPNFEVKIIPDSRPKTKPKALNYGLQYAKGDYLVIYDAEDIPEPSQLKKAWAAFQQASSNVACIQAKLQYYNPEHNMLTRLFAIEYLLLFDLILPGLQATHAPIPLGGTSNHFRTAVLRKLRGWDAFNVTEDADLGMRLYRYGYQTEIIDSVTLEEANSSVPNWIKQRTRWIKGYIQTYFVHLRSGNGIAYDVTNPHTLTFHLFMGWKTLFLFINPFLWLITLIYFVFRAQAGGIIESFFPPIVLYIGSIVLITGNFLYLYMYLIALGKRSKWDLVVYVALMPFYWVLMSYAGVHAFIEFIVKPHHWNKTVHGLYTRNENINKFIPAGSSLSSGIENASV